MAQRVARRAHVNEQGVAVCFAFNNLLTSLLIGMVEDVARFVPTVGSCRAGDQPPDLLLPSHRAGHRSERVCISGLALPHSRQAAGRLPAPRRPGEARQPEPRRFLQVHPPRPADLRRRSCRLSRHSVDSPRQVHRPGGEQPRWAASYVRNDPRDIECPAYILLMDHQLAALNLGKSAAGPIVGLCRLGRR